MIPFGRSLTCRNLSVYLIILISFCVTANVFGVYQESGGVCVMEAENADIDQNSDTVNW